MKDCIMKILYAFLLSTALFILKLPELKDYLLLVIAISCYVLLSYGLGRDTGKKNWKLFKTLMSILLGNAGAYIAMKCAKGARQIDAIESVELLILAVALLFIVIFSYTPARKREKGKSKKQKKQKEQEDQTIGAESVQLVEALKREQKALLEVPRETRIYMYRFYDMERLTKLFCNVPVIGIDAEWGGGKSYLINQFCSLPTIQKHFDVIRIDLLSCNYDEVEKTLFRKLDEIFEKHHVFSSASQSLQKALKTNSTVNSLYEFFFHPYEGYSSTFEGLNEDINSLDKGIIIVYDDIDRINEPKTIKKLFGISEKIASYGSDVHDAASGCKHFPYQDRVHIFYLFDRDELVKQKFERSYLEKYIPFTLKLTDMNLDLLLKELWKTGKFDDLGVTQKQVLDALQVRVDMDLEKALGFSVTMRLPHTSIRKAEIFLQDIQNYMESGLVAMSDSGTDAKEYKELIISTIIVFSFIKNYYYSVYELLDQNIGRQLTDIFTFTVNDNEMTINELVRKSEDAKKDANQNGAFAKAVKEGKGSLLTNAMSLNFICLFRYPIDKPGQSYIGTDEAIHRRGLILQRELPSDLLVKNEDRRSRIDHLISNLLQNGRSEHTDIQEAVNSFCAEVLPERTNWKEAWESFQNKYYNGEDIYKDNNTVFLLFGDRFLQLFQGFYIYRRSPEEWCGLLDFYTMIGENQISAEFVQNLYYCEVHHQEVYLKALETFCNAKVIGNLNHIKDYAKFLQKYLRQVFYFGYNQDHVFEPFVIEIIEVMNENVEVALEQLQLMAQAIMRAPETGIPQLNEELGLIKRFIEKNIIVIKEKNDVHSRSLKVQTNTSSRTTHQEKVDEFLARLKSCKSKAETEQLKEDINQAYRNRELFPSEANMIMKEFEE